MGCVEGLVSVINRYNQILMGLLLFTSVLPPMAFAVQNEFISLDCGNTQANKYNDSQGIEWSSDEGYIQTGKTASLPNGQDYYVTLRNLRFFPGKQDKNCYVLQPLTIRSKYLIRASFFYGNYDNLNRPPAFDLQFDASQWTSVNTSSDLSVYQRKEMIIQASKNSISVCLARSNPTQTPFITSLELREMAPEMYHVVEGNRFAVALRRINYRAKLNQREIRYPIDPFDRIWYAYNEGHYVNISTSEYIYRSSQNKVPTEVMQTAITTSSVSQNITLTMYNKDVEFDAYVIAYFTEIENYSRGIRAFDIYMNDAHWYNFSNGLDSSNVEEISSNYFLTDPIEFRLVAREGSALGPMLNALECYQVEEAVQETLAQDVEALDNVKASFNLEEWTGDPRLPDSHSWEWVQCSSDSPPRITALSLANTELKGSIPDFSSLTELRVLDLQHNYLSGPIPEFLAHLPKLIELNVAYNNLSGPVPKAIQNNQNLSMNISGNPYLYMKENSTYAKGAVSSHSGKSNHGLVKFGIIVAGVTVLVIFVFTFFIMFKRDRTEHTPRSSSTVSNNNNAARAFTYAEVRIATKDFSRKLGEGGFGPVFHGCLPEGQEIAVKVLSSKSHQGPNEFSAEVALLSRIHHKNLVSLKGFCSEHEHRILIYEYIPLGSLRHVLHGPNSSGILLDWRTRLDIALNASQGLEYLHTGCNPAIIHRDVKSDNILLSHSLLAKVSDFGLSKALPVEGATHVSTFVKGTAGYVDPEYYNTSKLSEKSDVYSFGVLLLEIISGRPPNNMQLKSEQRSIIEWVQFMLSRGNIQGLVEPILLRNDHNVASMWKVAELAMACVDAQPVNRPTMSDVVYELREAIRLEMPVTPSVSMRLLEVESTSPMPFLSSTPTFRSSYKSYGRSNSLPQAR